MKLKTGKERVKQIFWKLSSEQLTKLPKKQKIHNKGSQKLSLKALISKFLLQKIYRVRPKKPAQKFVEGIVQIVRTIGLKGDVK